MHRSEWLALLLAAAAIIVQSFVPPAVGLADNGDFPKIIGWFDTGNPSFDRDVARFADTRFVVDPKFHYESRFYSSEILLFTAALGLNSIFGNPDVFDLRLMGAVHGGLFLLAFFMFLPLLRSFGPWARCVIVAIVLITFTDVMYVCYFNSFYMDTAALLFMLLSAVTFLRALLWQKSLDRWLFVASAALLVTSKAQHYPLAVPIALLLAWKGGLLTPGRGHVFRALAVTVVLAAAAFSQLFSTPPYYAGLASYNVMFSGLLPKSKDVLSDLNELGLDNSYRRYIGTNAYSADAGFRDPQFEAAFTHRHFYPRIALFFLKHPSRALDAVVARMDSAGVQRSFIGNFDRSTGLPEYTRSQSFATWSNLKARVFGRHGGRYLTYSLLLVLFVTVLATVHRRSMPAGLPEAACTLAAMMLMELLVTSFGDALDAERHYSLLSAQTDLLIVSGVCLSIAAIRAVRKPRSAPATLPVRAL
jgi:hypothetical protein